MFVLLVFWIIVSDVGCLALVCKFFFLNVKIHHNNEGQKQNIAILLLIPHTEKESANTMVTLYFFSNAC